MFKARRVARATRDLNPAAASHVDDAVAPYLHGIGTKALDEVVEKAIWTHDLPRALAEAAKRLDQRGITIDLDTPLSPLDSPTDGAGDGLGPATAAVCQVFGYLDRADAPSSNARSATSPTTS